MIIMGTSTSTKSKGKAASKAPLANPPDDLNRTMKPQQIPKAKPATREASQAMQARIVRKTARLELEWANAREVLVAGTFNEWNPTPMQMIHGSRWAIELRLKPGRYEYRFIVDGLWQDDPYAFIFCSNPFGTRNSVLILA
ncbi:MAG: glycoside hydrolase family 13 [Verrucomicrobiales bacterium]|nr:glycoside hydrolase family 13 [Verrucomicrobiales bacterium]